MKRAAGPVDSLRPDAGRSSSLRVLSHRRPPATRRGALGLLGAALASISVSAMGVEIGAPDEDPYFTDLPVVASVSRLPQQLADASASVTVIERDMIRASGARDLNDLFRLVPGFQTYPNNTDAARVTYHGLTDEDFSPRVQVLVDGRSQYSPLFRNGVNWATVPVALEDIERIEVVRGSNAVSYGSNAFMGVINIVTVSPALVRGVSVGVNRGNQGVRDVTLRGGGRLGEAGGFRVTYQAKDDDGLEDRFDWKDSFESRLVNVRTDLWLSDEDQLQLDLGHIDAVTERGRLRRVGDVLTGGEDPANPFRDFTQSHSYFQTLWRRALDPDSDLQLRYSYLEDRASEEHIVRFNPLLIRVDSVGDVGTRHELEGQHTTAPMPGTRLVWGGGYRLDSLRSDDLLYDQGTVFRRVGRVFGNLEWKPTEWFTGNLGAAAERDSLAGRNFSPRASAAFHLTPEHTIRLGASRAYRTGSIVDHRGDRRLEAFAFTNGTPIPKGTFFRREFYADPDTPQERVNTVELAYLGEWQALRSSLDVRVFRERIPNRLLAVDRELFDPALCDTVPPPGVSCTAPERTEAVQRVKISGVEYQWRWQPFEATRLLLGQAFVRIESSFLPGATDGSAADSLVDPSTRNRVEQHTERSAPRRSTSLLLMQKLPGDLDLSIAGYWVDSMKWTRNSSVDFYRRFDLRLGYPFRIGGQRGEVAYTAQSINGEHGEFRAGGDPADRVVDTRQWVSLRLDF